MAAHTQCVRRILQTAKDVCVERMRPLCRTSVASWQAAAPTWAYELTDDDANRACVASHAPWFLDAYDSLPREINRADAVRFVWLWAHGGLYADTDFVALRDPQALWDAHPHAHVLLGSMRADVRSSADHALPNALMMARAPHHLLWLFAMEHVMRLVADGQHTKVGVEKVAGPVALLRAYEALQHACADPGRLAAAKDRLGALCGLPPSELRADGVHLLPPQVWYPIDWRLREAGEWRDRADTLTVGDLRAAFPDAHAATVWAHSWAWGRDDKVNVMGDMEEAFSEIYAHDAWGGGSGPGSRPEACAPLVQFLQSYFAAHQVRSMVDLGCGDVQWVSALVRPRNRGSAGVAYTGVDCVKALEPKLRAKGLAFHHADVAHADPATLPQGDVYLMKDVLQHWPSAKVEAWLRRFFRARPTAHLLVANCCDQRHDDRELPIGGFVPLGAKCMPLALFAPQELFAWSTKALVRLSPPKE